MGKEKGEKESATSLPYQRGVTGALGAASLSVSHFAVQRPSARPTITWNRTPVLRELIEFLGASPTTFPTPSTILKSPRLCRMLCRECPVSANFPLFVDTFMRGEISFQSSTCCASKSQSSLARAKDAGLAKPCTVVTAPFGDTDMLRPLQQATRHRYGRRPLRRGRTAWRRLR